MNPLPCPFCGAPATVDLDANNAFIECSGHCRMHPMLSFIRSEKEDAIAAWNRRAPPVAAEGVGQSYQRNIDGGQMMAEGVRYNNGEIPPPEKESQP